MNVSAKVIREWADRNHLDGDRHDVKLMFEDAFSLGQQAASQVSNTDESAYWPFGQNWTPIPDATFKYPGHEQDYLEIKDDLGRCEFAHAKDVLWKHIKAYRIFTRYTPNAAAPKAPATPTATASQESAPGQEAVAVSTQEPDLIRKLRGLAAMVESQEGWRPTVVDEAIAALSAPPTSSATPTATASHCMCDACKHGVIHSSDCAVHNAPAEPKGPCDCGATASQESAPGQNGDVQARSETRWLIELVAGDYSPAWFSGMDDEFVKDANKAIQFPSHESAYRVFEQLYVAKHLRLGWDCYAITEHQFIYPTQEAVAIGDGKVAYIDRLKNAEGLAETYRRQCEGITIAYANLRRMIENGDLVYRDKLPDDFPEELKAQVQADSPTSTAIAAMVIRQAAEHATNGEYAYEMGRGLYESEVDKSKPGWELFYELTNYERATWIVKAALQKIAPANAEAELEALMMKAVDYAFDAARKPGRHWEQRRAIVRRVLDEMNGEERKEFDIPHFLRKGTD